MVEKIKLIQKNTGASVVEIGEALRNVSMGMPLPKKLQNMEYVTFFQSVNRVLKVEGARADSALLMGRDLPNLLRTGAVDLDEAFLSFPPAQKGAVKAMHSVAGEYGEPTEIMNRTATKAKSREQKRLQIEYAKRMVAMRMKLLRLDFNNSMEVEIYVREKFEEALNKEIFPKDKIIFNDE
jgi:hypothetical protein